MKQFLYPFLIFGPFLLLNNSQVQALHTFQTKRLHSSSKRGPSSLGPLSYSALAPDSEQHSGKDSTTNRVVTDRSEHARQLEERFRHLQEETRQSQREMAKQLQKQSQVIALLTLQAQKQEERCQEQTGQIKRLSDLVRKVSSKDDAHEQTGHKEEDGVVVVVATMENPDDSIEQSRVRQSRSDDIGGWEPVVNQISRQVERMNAEVQALNNWADITRQNSGTTYVRWGSTSCPSPAQLLYSGYVGGSWFDSPGSAVNYLCLPKQPVFDDHKVPPVVSSHNHVQVLYGAEYQASTEEEHDKLPACSVCHAPKSSTVMIPATDVCAPGWTREYHGYLMAGATTHASASEFVCVDVSEEYVAGTSGNEDGKLFYYTVTHCGSLPCPPYVNGKVVTCVVCSK